VSIQPRDLQADLVLAHLLADAADAITLTRFQSSDLVIETKPDATPVTDADRTTEKKIRELIASHRPEDLVIGEEFGAPTASDIDGKYYWVIDPIDGTKNFLRGIPVWATLIGLVAPDNTVVAGVVSSPALGRRWSAAYGQGAFVSTLGSEPKKIHVSAVSKIEDAQLSYSDLIGWGERKDAMLLLQEKVWRTRGIGDFWSHMLVAEGSVDIAVEPVLALWDMAALEIIVREAGGTFTNLDGVAGSHGGSLVTSNGKIHAEFLTALNQPNAAKS